MNLSLKNIKELTDEQILNLLLPTVNMIFEKYNYGQISEKEFNNLVLKQIKISKKDYNGNVSYEDYIVNKIKKIIKIDIQKKLSDEKNAAIITKNFINKQLKKPENENSAMKFLKNISSFFKNNNYIPNVNVLIELIEENESLSEANELIIAKYETQITSGNLSEVIDDSIIITIVEVYCLLNKIDIKNTENNNDNINYTFETNDSLKMYLKETDNYPLLTKQEEIILAKRIAKGDEEAKQRFIESNLKLVVPVARKYIGRGLSLSDLIQEGNLGLMEAVDRFDASKGFRFSTYAVHWIVRYIHIALYEKSKIIKYPGHYFETMINYKKTERTLEAKLERKPTIEEIAHAMGISLNRALNVYKSQNDAVSINALIDDTETELEDLIAAEEETMEERIIKNTIPLEVKKLLKDCNLNERQMDILAHRYMLGGKEFLTLEELGEKYNVTRERIRQIEHSILMKLRRSSYVKELAQYMEKPDEAIENIQQFRKDYRDEKIHSSSPTREKRNTTKLTHKVENETDKINIFVSNKLSELSENPKLKQIEKTLTDKELMVLILMLGKNDDEKFTTKEITHFLDITFEEFLKITKRILCMYREEIYCFLNESSNNNSEVKIKKKNYD